MAKTTRRLSATCRSRISTASPTVARESGITPPAAAPASPRSSVSENRSGAKGASRVNTASRHTAARITRRFPSASPTGPSTGCTSAKGTAKAVASSATLSGATRNSSDMDTTKGSVTREVRAPAKQERPSSRIRRRVRPAARLRIGRHRAAAPLGRRRQPRRHPRHQRLALRPHRRAARARRVQHGGGRAFRRSRREGRRGRVFDLELDRLRRLRPGDLGRDGRARSRCPPSRRRR